MAEFEKIECPPYDIPGGEHQWSKRDARCQDTQRIHNGEIPHVTQPRAGPLPSGVAGSRLPLRFIVLLFLGHTQVLFRLRDQSFDLRTLGVIRIALE